MQCCAIDRKIEASVPASIDNIKIDTEIVFIYKILANGLIKKTRTCLKEGRDRGSKISKKNICRMKEGKWIPNKKM